MRFTTKTEYGIVCLVYVARHTEIGPVSIKQIVEGEQYSRAFVEKIVQTLRAANILLSQQGSQGGYRLARPASKITLLEVIEALEGGTFDVFCEPNVRDGIVCTHFPACDVKVVWERTKNLLDRFYGSITLEMLVNHELQSQDLDKLLQ